MHLYSEQALVLSRLPYARQQRQDAANMRCNVGPKAVNDEVHQTKHLCKGAGGGEQVQNA